MSKTPPKMNNVYDCPAKCGFRQTRKLLISHLKYFHKYDPCKLDMARTWFNNIKSSRYDKKYNCEYCNYTLTTKVGVHRHIMRKHPDKFVKKTPKLISWNLNSDIEDHFNSEAEFEEWKSKKEEETGTSFSKISRRNSGDGEVVISLCHRHKIRNDKRLTKGLRKTGHIKKDVEFCTAFLKVRILGNGKFIVNSCFNHTHPIDWSSLRFTTGQTKTIIGLVKKGLDNASICAKLKEEYPETSKLHYATTDDIRNIKQRFNLNGIKFPITEEESSEGNVDNIIVKEGQHSDSHLDYSNPESSDMNLMEDDEPNQSTEPSDDLVAELNYYYNIMDVAMLRSQSDPTFLNKLRELMIPIKNLVEEEQNNASRILNRNCKPLLRQ